MPSARARLLNLVVRSIAKRKSWGSDDHSLAKRARRTFGSLAIHRWLISRGIKIERVQENGLVGDILSPPGADQYAIILYIHGGGFVACSALSHRPIIAAVAKATRLEVFAVDYRLAPEHRFPAALDDVHEAYSWLHQRYPNRQLIVMGDSAGGGLTLSLLLRLRDAREPMPRCAICFSPWTDLTASNPSVSANSERCHMFYAETGGQFAKAYVSNPAELTDHLASPYFAELSGLPPVLFQVGSTEILFDDSALVHKKIKAAGGESELQVYDDVFHVWQMGIGLIPEARIAIDNAADFIKQHVPIRAP